MHDLSAAENTIQRDLHESSELLGKECASCQRALEYSHFRRDSSLKDGRSHQCVRCEASPRLSTAEHVHRLREGNNNSEAVKAQRWEDQDEFKKSTARVGTPMRHIDFFEKLKRLVGDSIYFEQGAFESDLAIYRMYGSPQPRLQGRQFEYITYCPKGTMPEYGLYEFDEKRDVLTRELLRGWRTVLLTLIKMGIVTETDAHRVFGEPHGEGSYIYRRDLYRLRCRRAGTNPVR